MKKIINNSLLIIMVGLLVACDFGQSFFIKKNDQYIEVVPQATIEILKVLTVEPNSARAFLQNGVAIHQAKLNLYDIDCEVEINTVSELRQTIQPGIFNVFAISEEESPIVTLRWGCGCCKQ